MKTLLFAFMCGLVLFGGTASAEKAMYLPIGVVIDGDTISTVYRRLPTQLSKISIRIIGIDSPEAGSRAKCEKERLQGLQAKAVLAKLTAPYKRMVATNCKYDKFGGRWNCDVRVGNIDIRQHMLDSGLVVPYYGAARPNWCEIIK